MRIRTFHHRRAFVLPMTIMAVLGLFILLIGLIAMLSLERKTARSYSDATRAELALQSGLSDALSTLSEVTSKDDSLVFRMEDPTNPTATLNNITREQFFTYGATFNTTSSSWRTIPLFSGALETPTTAAAGRPDAPDTTTLSTALKTYTAGTGKDQVSTLGRLSETDTNVPRAKWVELPQATGEYIVRYSWWVEDLNGRIDGRSAGSQPRTTGLSTAELGIYTLFNPTSNTVIGGPQDALVTKRNDLLTAASARTVLPQADAKVIEPYLTYSPTTATSSATPPPPTIPHGFGYADAGKPAIDLNAAVASRDLTGIADHITRNLPNFFNRRGGFPAGEDYVKTLAASIIDYADSDTNATAGVGYRGVDSYPFVNELFDRYEWTGTSGRNLTVKVTTFAEFWNPTQLAISGSIEFENQNKHKITIPLIGEKTFSSAVFPATNVSIPANGYSVVLLGEKNYTFAVGSFPPSQLTFTETTTSNYQLKWNGTVVDSARGGLQRTSGTLNAGASNRKWKGNSSPALDISIGQSGDPRASYYVNTWVFSNNYDGNTSWGGRNKKSSISNANYNEVKITNWMDRGSDSSPGTNAGSDAKLPTELTFPANQPLLAPTFISNIGRYANIGELGHIYDPAQWTQVNATGSVANPNAGGGFTLAIGRPEFAVFDRPGLRAAQLADLFYVSPPTSAAVPNATKININTAPREVLRTLVAGVTLNEDPAQPVMYPAKRTNVGDLFADCVINTRNYAPLRGISDLSLIRLDPLVPRNYATPVNTTEPFFGGRSHYSPQPSDTWDDAGREELLRKVVNLVSFQGKSFRIVVAGEALNKTGGLLGRTTKEFHVLFEPQRDSNGALVTNGKMTIRKIYEKSL